MALVHARRDAGHAKRDAKDTIEFRLIFLVSFMFFLAAALVERMLPWRWHATHDDGGRRPSVFAQARDAAGTCTTYAFMG